MGDIDEKEKYSRRRKRNIIAKELRTPGPYAMKVVNPKKTQYKRIHLNIKDINENEDT